MSSENDVPVEPTPQTGSETDNSSLQHPSSVKNEENVVGAESSSGTGSGSFMDRFHIREYATTAEERASQLNSQFGSLCNRLKGDNKTGEENVEKAGEESLVSQITDFGTKGYGLMGSLGKKFEK